MYDPNKDAQEILRKLALEKLLMNNAAETAPIAGSIAVQPPTAASIELNVPAPDVPPTTSERMAEYAKKLGEGALSYTQSGFVPTIIDPVQRGGGLLEASSIPMAPYGQGLIHSFGKQEEDDKDGPSALRRYINKKLKKKAEAKGQ